MDTVPLQAVSGEVLDDWNAVISGARACGGIWDMLPKWRWTVRAARIPGSTALLEGANRAFLQIRLSLARATRGLCARADAPDPARQ